MTDNNRMTDAFSIAMERAREIKDGFGLVGFGVVELRDRRGLLIEAQPFANLITDAGDLYYATRGIAAVSPATPADATKVNGMKLGTGTTDRRTSRHQALAPRRRRHAHQLRQRLHVLLQARLAQHRRRVHQDHRHHRGGRLRHRHATGGAFDLLDLPGNADWALARDMGADASWSRPFDWDHEGGMAHFHGVLTGCPHNGPARYQIDAVRAGFNGLGHLGHGAPDNGPPLSNRTWREGITWAKEQVVTEDEVRAIVREELAKPGALDDVKVDVGGKSRRRLSEALAALFGKVRS
jgi:hypothetical protein